MSTKRALVVDDSRSARVILSRMLETYGLAVDTAESGEQALDYLRNARPDVVFMDHLMPGMDGFEAVRAMKSNAQTATIPVMMYTSQEGDHYMQQARKAGAVGVLSKTLKPTDVSRALYELHLLPDRREGRVAAAESSSAAAADFSAAMARAANTSRAEATTASLNPDLRAAVTSLVSEQQTELHQLLQSRLDAMSDNVSAQVRAAVTHATQQAMQQISMSATGPAADAIESNSNRSWFAAALLLMALIPTAVIATLYWRTLNDNRAQLEQSAARLAMVVTEQQTQIEQLRAELRKHQEAAGEISLALPNTEAIAVPYHELPLAGARVERLKAMIERLKAEHFRGKLRVSSFVGDFCLSGNTLAGYKLARDDLSVRRCDLVGNPFEDSLAAEQRETLELTSLLAALRGDAAIQIEVQAEGRKPIVNYPPQTDKLTAGEWNRIAARNNRVEFVAVSAE